MAITETAANAALKIRTTSMHAPYVVFGPAIMVQIALVVHRGLMGLLPATGLIMAGLFSWTLLEYFLHRFSFHSKSDAAWVKPFNSGLHLWHHQQTTSELYLAAPIAMGIPVYAIFLSSCFALTRNFDVMATVGSGVIAGYLVYEWVHYAAHMKNYKNPLLKYLRRYHLVHHFRDSSMYFGVTSPLWDLVFGTRPETKTVDATKASK